MNPAEEWRQQRSGAMYPAVAFERPGYIIKGKVAELPRLVTTPSMNGSGDEETYVVAVDVLDGSQVLAGKSGERKPAQPGERVSIWFRSGAILNALSQAISRANAQGLAVGGMLAVRREADGQGKPGLTPPHMYTVQYIAPVQEVALPVYSGDPFPPQAVQQPTAPDPFANYGQQPAAPVQPAPAAGDLFA